MRNYSGQTVVITGAAGGLGSALARALRRRAPGSWPSTSTPRAWRRSSPRWQARGATALGLACDVSDAASCPGRHRPGHRAVRRHRRAGQQRRHLGRCLLRDAAPAVTERVMAVNFFGAVNCTQAALASLCTRRGQILCISQHRRFSPLVGRTAYAASKHALHGFFDSLRSELQADGVAVMLVCPSFIATGIEAAALGGDGAPAAAPRQTGPKPRRTRSRRASSPPRGAASVCACPRPRRAWRGGSAASPRRCMSA